MFPKVKKVLDLSHSIYHACPGWPTHFVTRVNYEAIHALNGYNAEIFEMNSHTGTHLDAPYHFFPDGKTVDEIPVEKYQGQAVVVDLRGIAANSPILPEHILAYSDKIQKDDIIILYTGWGKKRGFNEEYLFKWPYVSKEAAEWLVQKEIKGLCTDGMSIGGWDEGTGRPPHEVLLNADVFLLEEVNVPEEIMEEERWFLTAFPLKGKGFSGAPVRAVAFAFE
ncbi:cyclase family protein [Petroclostridium sp. X23]|uniref:cyclase family protein n=1 Tax=Petroclostridium sp. X23 TaxID=3045146 RepID=UPI0024AE1656|nr:cyclase family protein [Petroclostridium sp. X23]WHH57973.1 cyclase family protein [Petroclostridium sp. X23]